MFEKELLNDFADFLFGTGYVNEGININKLTDRFLIKNKERIRNNKRITIEYLVESLDCLPDVISKKVIELLEKQQKQTELDIRKKALEDYTMIKVSDEVDVAEDGKVKKRFSNELQRKTECKSKLEANADYQDMIRDSLVLSKDVKNLELVIGTLKRQNSNNRAKALLIAGLND